MSRLHRRSASLVVLLSSVITGCAGVGISESNLGGDGLPVQIESQPIPHRSEPVEGVIQLHDDGCWAAEIDATELLTILPVGFAEPPDDGAVMCSPDGTRFVDGMVFEGFGAVVPIELLPGVPDGFFGGYLSFCDPEAQQVIVLDSIRPVSGEAEAPK